MRKSYQIISVSISIRCKSKRRSRGGKAAEAKGQPVKLTSSEEKFAVLHRAPTFPYAPKVLTLRTTGAALAGSISAAQLGGMGFGKKSSMLKDGTRVIPCRTLLPFLHPTPLQLARLSSPMMIRISAVVAVEEEAEGSKNTRTIQRCRHSMDVQDHPLAAVLLHPVPRSPPPPLNLSSLPPNSKHWIRYQACRSRVTRVALHYLLQTRGLVSALGSTMLSEEEQIVAESARQRRAVMNAQNAKPNGWDGGRSTQSRGGTKP